MSKESVQFIEMVRQAVARKRKIDYYRMYCDRCGKSTAHQLIEYGRWEVYVCVYCGARKEYCVR